MFEKEAEDSFKCKKVLYKWETDKHSYIDGFKDGAQFGYNKCKEELNHKGLALQSDMDKTIEQNIALKKKLEKSNEWHYVKDGDLPEVDNRIVLCVCVDGYIDEKKHYILKLLTRKEFPLFQPVYAWKEIVLPEQEVKIRRRKTERNTSK